MLRIDPQTNLVDKSIEVSAGPTALSFGETSVWVLCGKDGKIDRIDPKTNKVHQDDRTRGTCSGRRDGVRRGFVVGQHDRLSDHAHRSAGRKGHAAVLWRGRRLAADHAGTRHLAGESGRQQSSATGHAAYRRHVGGEGTEYRKEGIE